MGSVGDQSGDKLVALDFYQLFRIVFKRNYNSKCHEEIKLFGFQIWVIYDAPHPPN